MISRLCRECYNQCDFKATYDSEEFMCDIFTGDNKYMVKLCKICKEQCKEYCYNDCSFHCPAFNRGVWEICI